MRSLAASNSSCKASAFSSAISLSNVISSTLSANSAISWACLSLASIASLASCLARCNSFCNEAWAAIILLRNSCSCSNCIFILSKSRRRSLSSLRRCLRVSTFSVKSVTWVCSSSFSFFCSANSWELAWLSGELNEGERIGWEGVNWGFKISIKPVSTKEFFFDILALAGIASWLLATTKEVLETLLFFDKVEEGCKLLRPPAMEAVLPLRSLSEEDNWFLEPDKDKRLVDNDGLGPLSRVLVGWGAVCLRPSPPPEFTSSTDLRLSGAGCITFNWVGLTNTP